MSVLSEASNGTKRGARAFRWFAISLALALALLLTNAGRDPARAQEAPPPERPGSGEVLVKFEPGTPALEKWETHAEQDGRVEEIIPKIGAQVVAVEGDEGRKAEDYEADPDVEFAEPNGTYEALD